MIEVSEQRIECPNKWIVIDYYILMLACQRMPSAALSTRRLIRNLKEPHPPLLFERPQHFNWFATKLEQYLKLDFGEEVRRERPNRLVICRPLVPLLAPHSDVVTEPEADAELRLRNILYCDLNSRKNYVAFDTFNLAQDEIEYIAVTINDLIEAPVYTITEPHPYFARLLRSYLPGTHSRWI